MLLDWVSEFINMPFRWLYRKSITGNPTKVALWRIRLRPDARIVFGQQSSSLAKISFDRDGGLLSVGDRSSIGGSTIVVAERIEIGSDVLISWGCTISDHNSHSLVFSERQTDATDWIEGKKDWTNVEVRPVHIQDKVWIGFNAIVLKGVTVGEGAIVGAGSVVTKDVAPWTVVAGNPAREIRKIQPS